VRGDNASDGGPPMSERLGGNDRMFIQEDGAKEKNLLGTGACRLLTVHCKVSLSGYTSVVCMAITHGVHFVVGLNKAWLISLCFLACRGCTQ
jgi:hypothetical protein